jgi:sialic acid synthase SpsE
MTFIIAEVGSNWHNLSDCLESISTAKQCGADAVKFQLFSAREIYGPSELYFQESKWALDPSWLPILKEKADACGIEFMCTAFSAEGYRLVDPLVKRHKIASSDFNHVPLVRFVKSFGKPIIASCGGMSETDVKYMIKNEYSDCVDGSAILYCNSAYPSYEHDPRCMSLLFQWCEDYENLVVGISDHSKDVFCAPLIGEDKLYGGQFGIVIEKHFGLARIEGTPDKEHALDETDFKRMCDAVKGKTAPLFASAEEDEFRIRDTRRMRATCALRRGDRLAYGRNFGYFRSVSVEEGKKGGISPALHDTVEKWLVVRPIEAGEPITLADLVKE